jgi:4-hydroxybenzoate polyprenyltransferase
MRQPAASNHSDVIFGKWLQPIAQEFDITCRLLSSNASLGFGLYFIGLIPRILAFPETVENGRLLLEVFFAAFANEYVFDICNQAMSPDEDRCNRPDRPIPAGLLTVNGALRRWALCWLFSPLILLAIGCPTAALHLVNFEAWTFVCYVWPKPGHPFWKNLYTPVALFFSLRVLNGVLTSHAASLEMRVSFDSMFALWLFATIHVQDFHDVEGDRASGRRTLPIILSPGQLIRLRQVTAAAMVGAATLFVVLGIRFCGERYDVWIGILAALQFVGGVATGLYFLRTTTAREGEITYKWLHIPTALLIIAYLSLVNGAMAVKHVQGI